MKKLSKREKIMIYVMVLFLIVGGGFLLIRQTDLVGRYNRAQAAYEDKQMQLELASIDAGQKAGLDAKLQEELQKVQELMQSCKEIRSNDYIEQDMLSLAKKHHLLAANTSFEEQKEVTSASGQSISFDENGVQLTESNSKETETTGIRQKAVVMSVELKGSLKNYFAFLDAVDQEPCIFIRSSKIYDPNDRVSYQMNTSSSYTYYLQIQYDMFGLAE